MKTIKFISAAVLTMALAGCENFDLPNPPGQEYPEVDGVFENSGLTLSQPSASLNLIEANAANRFVTVADIADLVNFPAEYSLKIDMEVAGNDSFKKATTIGTTIDGKSVTVNPDVLNGAIQEVLSKAPGTYDVYARFVAYAVKGTTQARLGGLDATYGASAYSVRTLDPSKVIEDAYYLIGDFNNWGTEGALLMANTAGNDVSPYDNPEFAVSVDVAADIAEAGYGWKVVPASAIAAGNVDGAYGCIPSTDSDLQGKLAVGSEAGLIHLVGPVLITINMEVDSYTINYALPALYPLSGSTLSKPQNALLLYTDNYINYSGVSVLGALWYLCGQPDYRGEIAFRQDSVLGFEDSEDGLSRTGYLTSFVDNSTQLGTPIKGNHLYWIDANLVMQTYSITCLETISVIGSGNGWDLATATDLTPSKDFKTWTATGVEIGDNFKLCCNHSWTQNFGGKQEGDIMGTGVFNLVHDGPNMEAIPGTYDVTVDFSTVPYTVTLK